MDPIIRYWVKLNNRSTPMETDNLKNVKRDIMKSPSSKILMESVYPNYHIFENDVAKERIDGDLTDAQRSDTAIRLFNKIDQRERQVMRKKDSSKPKAKKCKC
jgi:hypothetical protein